MGGSWAKAPPQNKIPTWALPASVGPGLRVWSQCPVSSQPSGGAAQLLARPVPPSCAHSPASGCRETEAHFMVRKKQVSLAPRGSRGCLLGSVLQPVGNRALGELGCSSLTSNA